MVLSVGVELQLGGETWTIIKEYNDIFMAVSEFQFGYKRLPKLVVIRGGGRSNDRKETVPNTLRCIDGGAN